jgi:hypothetical protein
MNLVVRRPPFPLAARAVLADGPGHIVVAGFKADDIVGPVRLTGLFEFPLAAEGDQIFCDVLGRGHGGLLFG